MQILYYLIGGGLLGDLGINEVVEIGREALEGEVSVLSQHICCEVIVVVLYVEQEKVGKGLCSGGSEQSERLLNM